MHKLNRRVPKKQRTPEFKRPTHNDFKDSSELKAEKFTGVRKNSLNGEIEIWTEGDLRASISELQLKVNPYAYAEKYAEVFALEGMEVVVIDPTYRGTNTNNLNNLQKGN